MFDVYDLEFIPLLSVLYLCQGGGGEAQSRPKDRGAADETAGSGHRQRGKQADRLGYLKAQLPGPSNLRCMVFV